MTLEERRNYLLAGTDELKYSYNDLRFAVEGKTTNVHLWIGNEKCLADGGGEKLIYIRLESSEYSVPLNKDKVAYLDKPNKAVEKLAEKGFTRPISEIDEVLEITKNLKIRK